jgi:hypothetical protein
MAGKANGAAAFKVKAEHLEFSCGGLPNEGQQITHLIEILLP